MRSSLESANLDLMRETNDLANKYRHALVNKQQSTNQLLACRLLLKLNDKFHADLNTRVQPLGGHHDQVVTDLEFRDILDAVLSDVTADHAGGDDVTMTEFAKELRSKQGGAEELRDLAGVHRKLMTSVTRVCDSADSNEDSAKVAVTKCAELRRIIDEMR